MTANLKALVQKGFALAEKLRNPNLGSDAEWYQGYRGGQKDAAYSVDYLTNEFRAEIERMESEPAERARTADEGRTHWEGCWREHHACAVAKIEDGARTAETPETGATNPTVADYEAALDEMTEKHDWCLAEARLFRAIVERIAAERAR